MAITFFLQTKKNPARIWVRYRKRPVHIKAGTKFYVNPEWFEDGKIIIGNKNFDVLQPELNSLKDTITGALNSRKKDDAIDSNWLKDVIKEI